MISWYRCLTLLLLFLLTFGTANAVESAAELAESEAHVPSAKIKSNTVFYDSLEARTDRNWFLNSLYSLVFKSDSLGIANRVDDPSYRHWRGKPIRSIKIIGLEVFPADSTASSVIRLASDLGNRIHVNTHEWVIKENLFFREGDLLVPQTLRRNLIYLRKLKYIDKAQIVVVSSRTKPDSVDVVVAIKDKFSIKPWGGFSSLSKYQLSIDDQNFLGMGQQLKTEWHVDTKEEGSLGWKFYYRVPNIHGSFFNGELGWADLPGYSWKSATVNHPFLFPVKRAAGGMDLAKTFVWAPVDTTKVDKVELGGWYGYAIPGRPGPTNRYAYTALSVAQTWYHVRPDVGLSYGKLWHETMLVLGVLAVTESEYRYLPYVYTLLENEDIPVGFLYQFLFGHEFGEFRAREFLGLQAAWATVTNKGGFFYLQGGVESYFCKTGMEQEVLVVEPLYITPVQHFGQYRARTFVRGRAILGNKRFPEETLRLSTDPYFRGNRDLAGTDLIALGLEEDIIAPWNVLGFQFSFFGFFDAAVVKNPRPARATDNQIFTEGLGIRVRNPRLIWSSVELHVALNQGRGHFDSAEIGISAKVPLKLLDFDGGRPKPYTFH
jgi:hypothetical protein